MTDLRVGVVGVGALGKHHARIYTGIPGVKLVAVADGHAERGRAVAAQHGARWAADYRQWLTDVDAVSVVVPTVAHLTVAADFLRAGVPVLIEKPLAHDLAAGQMLVDLAERHKTLLQVGHIERFNPAWQAAAPFCQTPRYLKAERTSTFTFRSTDIGVVLDLMIHDLDLVLSLVRAPLRDLQAFGVGVMSDHEDAVQARLTFEDGTIADLTASRISPTAKRTVQAWTAGGCVDIDLHQRVVQRYAPAARLMFGESPVALAQEPGADVEALKQRVFGDFIEVEQVPVPTQDALTAELQAFVDCVRGGSTPLVDGVAGLRAMSAAAAVLQAVKSHAWNGQNNGPTGLALARQAFPQRRAA